jgi:dTDP-4-dehydrorhamnose reductase
VLRAIRSLHPDAIIHAAGSDRTPNMEESNRAAAANIADAARQVGARLLALSTDMVFDGRHPPYDEQTPPSPISAYGEVKAENERRFLDSVEDCLVVRTSLIYDFDSSNRQASWMEHAIAAGRKVTLFVDEIRNPVWAGNLADALLELVEPSVKGLLHVAGPRPMSRFEYGSALLTALGYNPQSVVEAACAAKVIPERPRDLTLVLDKARSYLSTPLLDIHEAVTQASQASHGQLSRTTTKR